MTLPMYVCHLSRSTEVLHHCHHYCIFLHHQINAGFIEEPSPITVAVGAAAIFRCRHASAHTIDWNINGRSLGSFIPPNVTQNILSSPGGFIHTLSILALEHYNETRVECVAITFLDETRINQRRQATPSVVLLVQGTK